MELFSIRECYMLNPFVRRSTFILLLIYFYKPFFILRSEFLSRLYSAIFSLACIHLSPCKMFWIFINLFIINIIYQAYPTMAILWIIFYYYHFRIARYFYILYSEQNHLVLFSFVLEVHSGPYVYHRRVIWTRIALICSIHISYFSLWLREKYTENYSSEYNKNYHHHQS